MPRGSNMPSKVSVGVGSSLVALAGLQAISPALDFVPSSHLCTSGPRGDVFRSRLTQEAHPAADSSATLAASHTPATGIAVGGLLTALVAAGRRVSRSRQSRASGKVVVLRAADDTKGAVDEAKEALLEEEAADPEANAEESEPVEAMDADDLIEDEDDAVPIEDDGEKKEKVEAKADEKEAPKKKASKWKCMDCGASNFAASAECSKCGARRPCKAEAALVEEQAAAKEEASQVVDGFLRLQADLQNYRRQHDESMVKAKDAGKKDALKVLLPMNAQIEEALVEPSDMTDQDKGIFSSYSMMFRKVSDVWAKQGVESLTVEDGEKFDPVRHTIVEEREVVDADVAPGTILEVKASGWKCNGKVVVPAEVAVAKNPEIEEEEVSEEEDGAATEEQEEGEKEDGAATEEQEEGEKEEDETEKTEEAKA